ncbi:phage tail spike protein [Lactococcus lactis]|uniref:phage tail spike protein n=1 Tax=Lactococcus lactis TaxID=1358 RepID=UPI00223B6E28|nr:phage tail spike protein [Lactococcus lactis]
MLITIHDNQMNKVGFLSNEAPEIPSFFNDTWHRYLAEGAATFSFSVNKFKNGLLQDYCQYLNDQAYISFRFDGQDHLFSVLTTEETDDVITLNCATLNLELRNEQVGPLVNSATHNIQWYFEQINLFETTQITIGVNEVSNLTRTISYDGQESKLSRLLSIIGNFNAEFEFITNLNDDGTFEGIALNIYQANDGVEIQGVGTWRNDVILYFGKNVTGVRRNVDRTQIFNASKVTGREGLNWINSEWSVKNSEGIEEFYKRKGATLAYAPLSAELYPAQIQSDGDRWIRKDFETEYKNVNDMWGYILSQFKKYAYALVTYEVSASNSLINQSLGNGKPLSIGDTVRIQDENFNAQTGGLILQARVSELEISFSNPSNNKLTFSNYVELESGISDDLEARLAQLIKDNTPYRAELTTTNGVQFKNGTGSTTLSAHIYKGSETSETIADSYEWSKDGAVVAPTQTITVDASGVADKAVYNFKATIAGKVVASQSVTITNVDDGTNGRSVTNVSQKWRLTTTSATPTQAWSDAGWLTTQPTTTATNKYLWSITRTTFNLAPLTQDVIEQKAVYGDKGDKGDTGNDGVAGKNGVGINSTTITYTTSSNGTVTPSTGWNSQVPTLVKGQYLWTKTVWNYSDGTSESGYTVSYIAKDGNNGTNGIAGKDGVGLKNTTVTYGLSDSETTQPSNWTNQTPTLVKGKYLWTKTVWAYTDDTSETGYQKTYIAKDGNNGNDGVAGKDGVGIRTTTITYAGSTSGTTAPNSGWTTTVPSVAPGNYLWTKTVWTYTDNSFETGYSVAMMGVKGEDGTDAPTITVKSYTFAAGSRAEIELTGPNAFKQTVNYRGHNVWVIDATTHKLREFVNCDTFTTMSFSHNGVSTTLADYLSSLKDSIVVIAASDADTVDQNFRDVLNSMGGSPDLGTWNWRVGHVFIGMSKRSDGTWPLQPRQGYEEAINKDGSAPEIGCTLSKGGIVAKGADGERGPKGDRGNDGIAGKDGDPGKIVSETEPTTRFEGLTWKYSGTSNLTASDGTVILSGTEYYWSGTNWILNEINSHNINGDNLNVTNGTFTDGKIKSTWDSGTASGSTEIENSHINMSATNSSSKATNSLGLDVQQGLGMRWSDPTSNQSRSVLLDYGNLSFDRNGVAAGLNFDGTNLSSSMPIQAPNTIVKTAQFSVSGIGIRLDRMMSFVAVSFSGQAASTINTTPTISNVIPAGFRPISPYSIDYMVPGHIADNGYIYFNPDGSIRIMATINRGYYIRGTRFYITNDVYPS